MELKSLPSNLRYEFLGPNSTYPVIVNASLNEGETEKLLYVLKKYPKAIGYTIDDIKGINPLLCMHKILLEEDYKPFVEHKRRLCWNKWCFTSHLLSFDNNKVLKIINWIC